MKSILYFLYRSKNEIGAPYLYEGKSFLCSLFVCSVKPAFCVFLRNFSDSYHFSQASGVGNNGKVQTEISRQQLTGLLQHFAQSLDPRG